MVSKARQKDLDRLNKAVDRSRHVDPTTDSLAIGEYAIITNFTGSQTLPKGFAIAIVDFGVVQRMGDIAVRQVLYKTRDSDCRVGMFIRFNSEGVRVRVLGEKDAWAFANEFKGE